MIARRVLRLASHRRSFSVVVDSGLPLSPSSPALPAATPAAPAAAPAAPKRAPRSAALKPSQLRDLVGDISLKDLHLRLSPPGAAPPGSAVKPFPESSPFPFDRYPITRATFSKLSHSLHALLALPNTAAKLPSVSSGLVVLSFPVKGGETCARAITHHVCQHSDYDFITISNADLFPRISGTKVMTSGPLRLDGLSGSGRSKPAVTKRIKALPGGLMIQNLGGGILFGAEDDEASGDEGGWSAPFPWFRAYLTDRGEPMTVLGGKDAKGEVAEHVLRSFEVLFTRLESIVKDRKRPLVVFYEDLVRLMMAPNLQARDTMNSLIRLLNEIREKHQIVFVSSSTSTFKAKAPNQSNMGNLVQSLISGTSKTPTTTDLSDFSEPEPPTDHHEPHHPTSKRPPTKISFSTPFDEYLGIVVIPVIPEATKAGAAALKISMAHDSARYFRHHNLSDLTLLAQAAEITLPEFPVSDSHGFQLLDFPLNFSFARSQFDSGLLEPTELESILLSMTAVSASNTNTTTKPSDALFSAVSEFEAGHHALQCVEGGIQFAGVFANPSDRLSLTDQEETLLRQCLVHPATLQDAAYDRIGGLESTKEVIRDIVALPLIKPELFRSGVLRQSTTGLLLFGPPGSGKSLLARATAKESGANFLSVAMSQITSMWVGEAEKNVKALFSLARKLSPCVIFIDEIDALLRARQKFQPTYVTNVINEFMMEWDGLLSNSHQTDTRVIVVGATNRPFDLDEAVLRRLPRRVLVDLPSPTERAAILKILLADDPVESRDTTMAAVAEWTHMYSGSDLKNLAIVAVLRAVKEGVVVGERHFWRAINHGEVVPALSERSELLGELREWDR
ncbi:hypothetical protein HK096_003716, partial [Nowakowskiella sp. JEL0078]